MSSGDEEAGLHQLASSIPLVKGPKTIKHLLGIIDKLHSLQRDGMFCDIKIVVGEKSFQAHKAVMAACSDFFMAMFSSGFKESHQAEVSITGKPEAFEVLLNWVYSGKLLLTKDNVLDVLEMAHYLQFNNAIQRCSDVLSIMVSQQKVNIVQAIRIMTTADVYNLEMLKKSCSQYIAENFAISDGFMQHMTADLMLETLKQNDLTIDEKQVFDTTQAWLQHDWENRKEHAPALLRRIRLGMVPLGHLSMTALRSADLYGIPECKAMIDNVFKEFDARDPDDAPLSYTNPDVFATRSTVTAIVSIGNSVMYYECESSKWLTLQKFPTLPDRYYTFMPNSSVVAQGQLYYSFGVAGVTNRKLKKAQFIKLDVDELKWRTLPSMKHRKPHTHPLLYLQGKIYSIGGDPSHTLCEAFNIKDNMWECMNSMQKCITGPMGGVVFDGKILIYGSKSSIDHTLLQYDPLAKIWGQLLTRSHFEGNCGLVVQDGRCYCVLICNCDCTRDGCKWRGIIVDELDISNGQTGERQSQEPVPESFKKRAFCIQEAVYIVCGKTFHKVEGLKVENNQIEESKLFAFDKIGIAYSGGIKFTFDKAKLL